MSTKWKKQIKISHDLHLRILWGVLLDTVRLKFPAAGYCNNGSVNNVGSNGNYWSSSLNSSNVQNGYNMNFNSSNVNWQNNNNRYNGFTVRGVAG